MIQATIAQRVRSHSTSVPQDHTDLRLEESMESQDLTEISLLSLIATLAQQASIVQSRARSSQRSVLQANIASKDPQL